MPEELSATHERAPRTAPGRAAVSRLSVPGALEVLLVLLLASGVLTYRLPHVEGVEIGGDASRTTPTTSLAAASCSTPREPCASEARQPSERSWMPK